jgi:hypothetical protein
MRNIDKLLDWERHNSRILYAFKDLDAKEVKFNLFDDPSGEIDWYIERNQNGLMAYSAGLQLNRPELKKLGVDVLNDEKYIKVSNKIMETNRRVG